LESGAVGSVAALARCEVTERATMSRCVILTTLAPEVVDAIFEETIAPELTLIELSTGATY
jgi:hypothetical protein